ncbi:hypothetical protein FRB90_012473 [Tulasnella sp. 427]|nr:hypothetical protein FRB90_012473 [Tulasnella sp. 427]
MSSGINMHEEPTTYLITTLQDLQSAVVTYLSSKGKALEASGLVIETIQTTVQNHEQTVQDLKNKILKKEQELNILSKKVDQQKEVNQILRQVQELIEGLPQPEGQGAE